MFSAKFPEDHSFILTIFGCQYHTPTPTPTTTTLISTFTTLLASCPAAHVETLEQETCAGPGPTRIWITHWHTPETWTQWWTQRDVRSFWDKLATTSASATNPSQQPGFWRETVRLNHRRALFESLHPIPNGLAHVGRIAPLGPHTGYWGALRDRLSDSTATDKLSSSIPAVPAPRTAYGGGGDDGDGPTATATTTTTTTTNPRTAAGKEAAAAIRPGRTLMQHFPTNLCTVIEGQDYGAMQEVEREYWGAHFDGLSRRWVRHVAEAGPGAGMLAARLCHAAESGRVAPETVDARGGELGDGAEDDVEWPAAFGYNRKVEVLWFLDMSRMESIGKLTPVHVKLRREFMEAYGPGGAMQKHDLLLWVQLGVAENVEAEYVGCYEGTGFMAYDHHPAFQAPKVSPWSPARLASRASQYMFGSAL